MKIPKAKQLPSGAWRVQVMVDGSRISVTDADPKVAQAKAAAMKAKMTEATASPSQLTVGTAIDRYIENKSGVLSPATIAGYKRIRTNALASLANIKLPALTQAKVQRAISDLARTKSSKTVRNAHGLLSAVLAEYKPDMTLRTTLPQKRRYEVHNPTDTEIVTITKAAQGTPMELPILLAVWLGLRASEICGITWDCIHGNTLHIKQAKVAGENGPTLKATKTFSGDRYLRLPQPIADLIQAQPHTDEYVVHLTGQAIYKRFVRLCEKAGVPHYRFHDLRHANASVMLALGVPDKYAMERMGHATPNMLKTTYQHTMKSQQEQIADKVDQYFSDILHTNLHTEPNDPLQTQGA